MSIPSKRLVNWENLGPRVRQVLEYVFEHPRATGKEIATALGISEQRVCNIRKHPKFVAAFPARARQKLKEAVPELTGRYLELARQNENLGVAEKVVARALDSQKVLESQPTTQINVFATLPTNDLIRKVEQIKTVSTDAIDTEIIETQP